MWLVVFIGVIHVWQLLSQYLQFKGNVAILSSSATILSINAAAAVFPKDQWKKGISIFSGVCLLFLLFEWNVTHTNISEFSFADGLLFFGCFGGIIVSVIQVRSRMTSVG